MAVDLQAVGRVHAKSYAPEWIKYSEIPSDVGKMFVAATPKGICWAYWPSSVEMIKRIEKRLGQKLERDDAHFAPIKRQVAEYFAGKRRKFDCGVDFYSGTEFQKKVWAAMCRIPYGQTRTYQWIAAEAGSPAALRAAGQACHNNPVPLIVPCHRVIGKDGSMTGYGGPSEEGKARKRQLLELEGAIKQKRLF